MYRQRFFSYQPVVSGHPLWNEYADTSKWTFPKLCQFSLACLLFYSRKEQTKQHINHHKSLSGSAYRTVTKQPSHDLMKGIGCPCLLSSELTQINFNPFYSAAGQADPPTSQASNHIVTYTPSPRLIKLSSQL